MAQGMTEEIAILTELDPGLMQMRQQGDCPFLEVDGLEVACWSPPCIDPVETVSYVELPQPPTLEELEQIHREAEKAGFEAGYAEGQAKGYAEALETATRVQQAEGERLRSIVDMAALPLASLDEQVETVLVDLAILIARQIIRRELRSSPGEVVAVVREGLSRLPMATRERKLHLHPEDVPLVRTALGLHEEEPGWRLEADPLVARGGCLLETESSYIDATVEARIAAAVSRLLGGEREGDRSDGSR
jgi:flagellar assembly protein FliH